MKKISWLYVIAIFLLAACSNPATPKIVKESFTKQFPGISPKWEKEEGKYEAVFKSGGNEMSAVFEANGTLLETEAGIPLTELSDSIKNYVSSHYNGAAIKNAAKITLVDGSIQYEAAIKDKDIIFDTNGNFIKEVKD